MDLLGLAAVIAAVGGLITILTTSFLQIRASNNAAAAIVKNTATLEVVHEQTNSNLAEVKEQLVQAGSKADKVMELSLEAMRRQLEVAQAEINRLNAAATPPPERGS